MNALEALEKWKRGSKARAVSITCDDGYGASCWVVDLYGSGKRKIHAWEVYFFELKKEDCPPELTFARAPWEDDEDDDWPGLEKTIWAALKKAEEVGL